MNRRTMLQYLASIAAGGSTLGALTGCASGAPQRSSRRPDRGGSGGGGTSSQPQQEGPPGDQSATSLRKLRSEHMYVATEIAPGVNIDEFGFKRAIMLPAKGFTDGDGMSVRPKLQELIEKRGSQTGAADFRGPFILDMEGPMFAGGLKSADPDTYNLAARRMNTALADLHSLVPGAMVSIYGSPFVRKTRMDFDEASRAVQRLEGVTFYNPSLYLMAPRRGEVDVEKEAALRREFVEFACTEAKRLGVQYVMPMIHHRYKGAAQPDLQEAKAVIPRDIYQDVQVRASRDGGAHGIILWQSDVYSMKVSRKDEAPGGMDARKHATAKQRYGNVSMQQLAQEHRDALRWTNEAFLSED